MTRRKESNLSFATDFTELNARSLKNLYPKKSKENQINQLEFRTILKSISVGCATKKGVKEAVKAMLSPMLN
jgi:hypothetical protein